MDESARIADGYQYNVLIGWGDPLFSNSPLFDVARQTGAAQANQFSYNCDYIAFLPHLADADGFDRGLCVNHEYTDANLMFPGLLNGDDLAAMTRDQVEVEMAAMGHSVVTIVRDRSGRWQVDRDDQLNRRLTVSQTPFGSAVGGKHPRMRTVPTLLVGTFSGTLNNCGGGMTPWGRC